MKQLFWLVVVIIAIVLGWFAASNRQDVMLAFWPLSYGAVVPVYFAVLGSLLIGFVLGGLATWAAGGRRRRESRRRARRILALERELAATQAQLPPPVDPAPAVPSRTGRG